MDRASWSDARPPPPSVKGFRMIGEVEGLPCGRHGRSIGTEKLGVGVRSCITHMRDPVLVGSNLKMQ